MSDNEMDEPTPLTERLRAWAKDAAAAGNQIFADTLTEAADELHDWERAFELYSRANHRAAELWYDAHPTQVALLPDQGKMIDWLCDELEALRKWKADAIAADLKEHGPDTVP